MTCFKDHIPKRIKDVIAKLETQGFDTWIVGGALRNYLLGETIQDWDLATQANPQEIQAVFPRSLGAGMPFGGATLPDMDVQLTTLRKDGLYKDFRRPESVTFSRDITEDLSRRDFTINAMAYRVQKDQWVDPFEGQKDLKNKNLKCVGDSDQRFKEDALRMFRAFRFASQYNLMLDPSVIDAIKKDHGLIQHLSKERIIQEWRKTLLGKAVDDVLQQMQSVMGFSFLPYAVGPIESVSAVPTVFWIRMVALYGLRSLPAMTWTPKPWIDFGMSKKEAQSMCFLHAMMTTQTPSSEDKVKWTLWIQSHPDQKDILTVSQQYKGRFPIYDWWQRFSQQYPDFRLHPLPLSNHDIMALLGLEPGPILSKIEQELCAWMIEHPDKASLEGIEFWLKKRYTSKDEV